MLARWIENDEAQLHLFPFSCKPQRWPSPEADSCDQDVTSSLSIPADGDSCRGDKLGDLLLSL